MLVDSSVWIDHYIGRVTAEVSRLRKALGAGVPIVVTDIILVEVLQGFRSDTDFETASTQMSRFPRLIPNDNDLLDAARLSRRLRSKGVNFGSVVDVLIAQAAISNHHDLLTSDTDFGPIARHSDLRLAAPSTL